MLEEALEHIRDEPVRKALRELIRRAKERRIPIRCGNHGYMQHVFTFAPYGTRHPAVVANPRRLTWYAGPTAKFPIRSIDEIPDYLF